MTSAFEAVYPGNWWWRDPATLERLRKIEIASSGTYVYSYAPDHGRNCGGVVVLRSCRCWL